MITEKEKSGLFEVRFFLCPRRAPARFLFAVPAGQDEIQYDADDGREPDAA